MRWVSKIRRKWLPSSRARTRFIQDYGKDVTRPRRIVRAGVKSHRRRKMYALPIPTTLSSVFGKRRGHAKAFSGQARLARRRLIPRSAEQRGSRSIFGRRRRSTARARTLRSRKRSIMPVSRPQLVTSFTSKAFAPKMPPVPINLPAADFETYADNLPPLSPTPKLPPKKSAVTVKRAIAAKKQQQQKTAVPVLPLAILALTLFGG